MIDREAVSNGYLSLNKLDLDFILDFLLNYGKRAKFQDPKADGTGFNH